MYYLLRRPISATSFRSLILSHLKSRPPTSRASMYAVRFHPLLFHTFATPHPPFSLAMPFTPSTEYRSTPRNVVSAFARVPFYPSAWRLIRVSSPHYSSLAILPCFTPFLSTSCPNAHLFIIPILASLPFPHTHPANYVSHLSRGSSNTGLPRWAATERGLMKNENGVEMRAEMGLPVRKTDSINAKRESRKKLCNNVFSAFGTCAWDEINNYNNNVK